MSHRDKNGLSREDLVSILGGSNVLNPEGNDKNKQMMRIKQQQESLACDAIG